MRVKIAAPAPWGVSETTFYWGDLETAPDIPLPEGWRIHHKAVEGEWIRP